jgi:hypothetical protein
MSPRRILGIFLVLAGIGVAAVPFLVPVPNDEAFFSVLREKKEPGEWTSRGSLYYGSERFSFDIEQRVILNDAGNITALEATLHAKNPAGENRVYRRTRYFDQYGAQAENVEESPTRTIKRGRGPDGKGEYRETVLADSSPFLVRPTGRWLCHGAGGLFLLAGLALIVLRESATHPRRAGALVIPNQISCSVNTLSASRSSR